MTLILETPKSDIHRCPACGAQCAVDRDLLTLARDSGQRIRVACHKCDEIFQPLNDNVATDVLPGAAQPSRATSVRRRPRPPPFMRPPTMVRRQVQLGNLSRCLSSVTG